MRNNVKFIISIKLNVFGTPLQILVIKLRKTLAINGPINHNALTAPVNVLGMITKNYATLLAINGPINHNALAAPLNVLGIITQNYATKMEKLIVLGSMVILALLEIATVIREIAFRFLGPINVLI